MNAKIRVLVVGLGTMGLSHARAYLTTALVGLIQSVRTGHMKASRQ
jgi:ABC-type arginine transport system permease subunit